MGLMSLIARKLKSEKYQPQIRAPPYESKISSKSPVRLVQPSSPSDGASKGSSKASSQVVKSSKAQTLPSLDRVREASFDSTYEDVAPAPVVFGYREDECPSRLSTRPTTSSKAGSRLSIRVSGFMPKSEPGTPATLHSHRPQSSISSSRFTSSIRNFSTGKTYVDLLDAQSEFKPLDFQGRVKASGARDYGEDVADRNITANGSKIGSQQESADYAQRRPISSWSRQAPVFSEEDEDESLATEQTTTDSTLWSKSLISSHPVALSSSTVDLNKKKALHRQTMQFAPPSSIEEPYSTPTLAELTAIAELQKARDKKNRRHSLQVSVNDANRIVTGWGASSPESDGGFRDMMIADIRRPATSNSLHRSLSTSSKTAIAFRSMFEDGNKTLKYAVNNQPILSPQPTSFHLSASLATSAITASHKRPSTMHSMHSIHSEQSVQLPEQTSNSSGMPDLSNLPNHLKEQATTFKHDWHGDARDRDTAPSPCIRTNRSRSQSGDSMYLRENYRPGSTSTSQPHSSEPEEHTPGRTNSTRHWSLSSSTPTTSSSSSAMYGRPQSRNTTCTSIDLHTMGLLNPSLLSVDSEIAVGQLPLKMPYLKADLRKGSSILPSKEPFNVDDYASDDNDSFINGQLGRAGNEEDLLFDSGYGFNGIQLPGLEDSFAASAPAPSISLRSSRRSKSVSKPSTSEIETCLDFDDMASVNDIMLSRPTLDDDEDNDFLSPNFDISRHRRSPEPAENTVHKTPSFEHPDQIQNLNRTHTPTRAHSPAGSTSSRRSETKRLTAIYGPASSPTSSSAPGSVLGRNSLRFHPHPSHYLLHGNNVGEQVIEEERFDDKVDIATAVRLRKESRAQKRASVMSISKPVLGNGTVKTISIEGRQRSSSTSPTKRGIPNIMDVPELTEDFGGLVDSE
ncbi:hypothetical protein F503_06366 [Ophiostoma piceae UAMH 11346]|uniref:Uncharacterized protein n=1 Tax=Ophiostoma piceae (strain UAMH 11346) TaxID=1262450 RepID=S3BWA6_OPHP1|nr:hypothetical protein F503_06366 [Ophiostoma piceae UAMH 11346]